MVTAIIVAAGKSERMGAATDKAFLSVMNKPVVAWSLLAFERCTEIDRIVLVVRKDQVQAGTALGRMFGISKLVKVVPGGNKRQDSVQAGLKVCDVDTRYVVVHDGARPCVRPEVISEVVKLVKRVPAVTVGHPVVDTIKTVAKGAVVKETLEREKLWAVQTPQAFQFRVLRDAYAKLGSHEVTDDCQAVERLDVPVKIYETLAPNCKVTTPEDLAVVAATLKS